MVKKKTKTFSFFFIYLALVLFVLDFASKIITSKYLPLMGYDDLWYPFGGIPVFSNFLGIQFSIVHAINKGAAWGIFADYQTSLLYFRIILIFTTLIYAVYFNKNSQYNIPLTLILTGATCNVLDYFIYGHVVDMFYFIFWGFSYPVFNIADILIFIGIFWLVLFTNPHKLKSG